jgi:hypothetical protein
MQAAFVRSHYIGYHDLFYPALDVLIVDGMRRDEVVDGGVNRLYLYFGSGSELQQAKAAQEPRRGCPL